MHLALTLLVCARFAEVAHWPRYVVWNLVAVAAILYAARKQYEGSWWEFAHDWLPALFFVTMFEEVSFLSLSLREAWQNPVVIGWESALFAVPPGEWLRTYVPGWGSELLQFGYLSFYLFYPLAAGMLWKWRRRVPYAGGFRHMTDALSVAYAVCYATYLLFPVCSPSHNVGLDAGASTKSGGPFHFLVTLVQARAGVHGNAFPSSHIMLACGVLVFAFRYFPRLAVALLVCVLLMCVGAVYDGYHYAIDVMAGALLGVAVGAVFVARTQPAIGNKQ
ncbi:MAG: phosphatase PAP2 family protein [Candidatus Korobacteraceae bacterium]